MAPSARCDLHRAICTARFAIYTAAIYTAASEIIAND